MSTKENKAPIGVGRRGNKTEKKRGLNLSPLKSSINIPEVQTVEKPVINISSSPTAKVLQPEQPVVTAEAKATPTATTPAQESTESLQYLQLQHQKLVLEATKAEQDVKISQLEQSLSVSQTSRKEFEQESTQLKSELAELSATRTGLEAKIVKLSNDLIQQEAELVRLKRVEEEATRERDELTQSKKDADMRNSTLAAEVAVARLQQQTKENETAAQIKQHIATIKEMQAERVKLLEEQEHVMQAERKKYGILHKEFEVLKKDHEAKSTKLDRSAELSQITKDMNVKLLDENKQLSTQLASERETSTKLHQHAVTTDDRCASLEEKVAELEESIKMISFQHFHSMALYIKLSLFETGRHVNVSVQGLWDKATEAKIDQSQWGTFIVNQMDAFQAKLEAQSSKKKSSSKRSAKKSKLVN